MKFLVILMYYNRPNLVRFALDSLAVQEHNNFEIAFIDDGSSKPGRPIANEYNFKNIKFYNTGQSKRTKLANGGSSMGKYVNMAVDNSDADVALMLCDDDALTETCLVDLDKFYSGCDESVKYSYGHVYIYNPMAASNYEQIYASPLHALNDYYAGINPSCTVDASQVSWRMKPYKDAQITFPYPQTAALDMVVYQRMYDVFGPCPFNGLFVQYKGIFDDQLGSRKDPYATLDKDFYDTTIQS